MKMTTLLQNSFSPVVTSSISESQYTHSTVSHSAVQHISYFYAVYWMRRVNSAFLLARKCNLMADANQIHNATCADLRTSIEWPYNLVPRARDLLCRGTNDSGIIHLIIASDWLGRNVAI